MAFTAITGITQINLAPNTPATNDISQFPIKMNAAFSAIQNQMNQVATAITDINALGVELAAVLAVSGVDIAALQTTSDEIGVLIAANGGLDVDSILGLRDEFSLMTDAMINLHTNKFADSGRFTGVEASGIYSEDRNANAIDITDFSGKVQPLNGSTISTSTEVARFYYNNNNNGGSAGTNNAIAARFAAAMGIDAARYAASWIVAEFITGSGTISTTHGNYHRFWTTGVLTKQPGVDKSFSIWIESDDQLAIKGYGLSSATRKVWVNGVRLEDDKGPNYDSGGYHLFPANTPIHYSVCERTDSGFPYSVLLPVILAIINTKIRVTLPRSLPVFAQLKPNAGVV